MSKAVKSKATSKGETALYAVFVEATEATIAEVAKRAVHTLKLVPFVGRDGKGGLGFKGSESGIDVTMNGANVTVHPSAAMFIKGSAGIPADSPVRARFIGATPQAAAKPSDDSATAEASLAKLLG